ncbi:MAG: hypothetical protein AABW64_04790 [Nanoarchaeota archaeon]
MPIKKRLREYLKEDDLLEQVEVTVKEDAFKGPFICCNKVTTKEKKIFALRGIEFTYEVWRCPRCNKEYLDNVQGRRFDKLLLIQKLLNEDLITVERSVNFDGKTFFVRFPKEMTQKWEKGSHAHIKVLGPAEYLIKVES